MYLNICFKLSLLQFNIILLFWICSLKSLSLLIKKEFFFESYVCHKCHVMSMYLNVYTLLNARPLEWWISFFHWGMILAPWTYFLLLLQRVQCQCAYPCTCTHMHPWTFLQSLEEDVWPPPLSFFIWISWERDSHWIWSLLFKLGYLASEIPGYSSLKHWDYRHQQKCLTLYMGATNLDSGS